MNRFPENYCFQITSAEYISLRCQNGTLKNGRGEHRKYLPYAFTEYGITMLAGILKSEPAIKIYIEEKNKKNKVSHNIDLSYFLIIIVEKQILL